MNALNLTGDPSRWPKLEAIHQVAKRYIEFEISTGGWRFHTLQEVSQFAFNEAMQQILTCMALALTDREWFDAAGQEFRDYLEAILGSEGGESMRRSIFKITGDIKQLGAQLAEGPSSASADV